MDDRARAEGLDRILQQNLTWVAAADSKTGPILAVDTAMLGVLAAVAPAPTAWGILGATSASLATVLLLVSLGFLVATVFPRLEGPKGSLIFFGGISSRDAEAYVTEVLGASSEALARDYALQIHRNAEIAGAKYRAVRVAMICLFCSILPWVAAVGVLYRG